MPNALGYWTVGTHYLHLAEEACKELVAGKNAHVIVTARPIPWEEYGERTRWSDHTVGIAILFNFFHGIEVILKGFIALSEDVPRHHRLTDLLTMFEARFPDSVVGNLIRHYTVEVDPASPLGQFISTNTVSIDDWYQALKYPESTSGHAYSHYDLKYGGEDTIPFWESIGQGAMNLCREAVTLSRSLETPPSTPA